MNTRGVILLVWACCPFLPAQPSDLLQQTGFPSAGKSESMVTIPAVGRYSFQVKSDQGVALELADHMVGPLAADGEPGVRDGRIDVLLDQSTYKLRLKGSAEASGRATVEAFSFKELQPNPVNIPMHRLLTSTLGDLEQRTWLLVLPESEVLRLEIMGRNLSDAVLWYPGNWVAGIQPTTKVFEPESGKPMTYLEFHHRLPAGTYLLTCYGGVPREWALDDGTSPLYLRRGIRRYGTFGTHAITISPFGRETFLVDKGADWHEISRRDKVDTWFGVSQATEEGSRRPTDAILNMTYDHITKESRTAYAVVKADSSRDQWVTINADPGDRIRYRHFRNRDRVSFKGRGKHWVGSMHSLTARDMLDVTAVLSETRPNGFHQPAATQVVDLAPGNPVGRRTNLTYRQALFLNVATEGEYIIDESREDTARAEYRIEPYFFNPPRDYLSPPFKAPGEAWRLTRGIHMLTVQARSKGILTFRLRHADDPAGEAPVLSPDQVRPDIVWPDLTLNREHYICHINTRDNTAAGVFARELPVLLEEGLPFVLDPGQSIQLPVSTYKQQYLYHEGDGLRIDSGGATLAPRHSLAPGEHLLSFTNTGDQRTEYYVSGDPDLSRLSNDIPRDGVEDIPELRADLPQFTDFTRRDRKFYRLNVREPGLYRVETSGRLPMGLTIRSKLVSALASGNNNGVGRNALVQQYLRPGTYLVTVDALGEAIGRAGVHLTSSPLVDGGLLEPAGVRKIGLRGDAAVRYRIETATAGAWSVNTIGHGKQFRTRLEDADGFPLVTPGKTGALNLELAPGSYRYYSLPEPVDSRRLTVLTRVEEPAPPEGKGPRPLSFNQTSRHLWMKPGADIYRFSLQSQVRAKLSMTAGMKLTLLRNGQQVWETEQVEADMPLLEPGDYEARLLRTEEDDRFPYSLTMNTEWLAPGTPQVLKKNRAVFSFGLADRTLVELSSMGDTDVRARLTGQNIDVRADDQPDDWNFKLSRQLAPGVYQLEVAVVGAAYNPVTIHMAVRSEQRQDVAALPLQEEIEPGLNVLDYPLELSGDILLRASAEGGDFALALMQGQENLGQSITSLAMPVSAGSYRLLVWSIPGSGKADFVVSAVEMPTRKLTRPVILKAGYYSLISADRIAWRLDTNRGALFSPQAGQPMEAVTDRLLNLSNGSGSLYLEREARLEPFRLEEAAVFSLAEQLIRVPLKTVGGPTLIEVESVGVTPGVAAGDNPIPNWDAALIHGTRAWTLVPSSGKVEAVIWKTADSDERHRVSIQRRAFKPIVGQKLTDRLSGSLEPGEAVNIDLPAGKNIELILDPGMPAAVHDGASVKQMIGNPDTPVHRVIDPGARKLTLVNAGDRAGLYRVAVTTADPTVTALTWDKNGIIEHLAEEPGELLMDLGDGPARVRFPEDTTGHLHDTAGLIHKIDGGAWTETTGGRLVVNHRGGLFHAVKGSDAAWRRKLIGRTPSAKTLPNSGRITISGKPIAYKLKLDRAHWVQVNTRDNLLTAIDDGSDILTTSHAPSQGTFLDPGSYNLSARPLAGDSKTKTLTVSLLEPIPFGGEEPVPERLIASGETEVFRFTVTEYAKVGVGLSAHADRLTADLFDTGSQHLGSGPFLLRELDAGDYLLVVRAGGPPVRYRPVVYGHLGPGNQIPDDVLRDYAEEANQ
ncbi:MAG: hypothetical protein QNK37_23635 [Acidobacteriota bacterium]|nr:hypothetical protein [Acidobacteriota bacterium]